MVAHKCNFPVLKYIFQHKNIFLVYFLIQKCGILHFYFSKGKYILFLGNMIFIPGNISLYMNIFFTGKYILC